jgi:hypothetical protein
MKLTNKHIADLTRARKLIADGDHDYICWALRYVGADVRLWRRIENLRAYRLRWIDHMIATRTL